MTGMNHSEKRGSMFRSPAQRFICVCRQLNSKSNKAFVLQL